MSLGVTGAESFSTEASVSVSEKPDAIFPSRSVTRLSSCNLPKASLFWFKKRIRFVGIDTWESRTRDLEEKKKGKLASERTRQLLEEVSSKPGYFRIKSHGLGKYGRVLGELFVMDKEGKQWSINDTLISEGHAYVYDGGKKKVFKNE